MRIAVLFAVLSLLSASDSLGSSQTAVAERVAAVHLPSGEILTQAPKTLARVSRPAVVAEVGVFPEFEVAAGSEVVWSAATRGTAPVEIAVEVQQDGAWTPITPKALEVGPAEWIEGRVEIPEGDGTRRLRLVSRIRDSQARPDEGVKVLWGVPVVLAVDPVVRPNIVLISLDTLGARHLSSYGNTPGLSPNIDAFLNAGASFRRAYASYPNTLVSHATLFSGSAPIRHLTHRGAGFRAETLVERFARNGYRTAAFTEGGYVSGHYGFRRGFDVYDDGPVNRLGHFGGDAAQTFAAAERWLAKERDVRSFLFVHTYEVHSPYLLRDALSKSVAKRVAGRPVSPFDAAYQGRNLKFHNTGRQPMGEAKLEGLRALYAAETHYLDRSLGHFLERLDALGLAQDTIVVVTSDHGEELGFRKSVGHGNSLHDHAMHVPLSFRWPGHLATGWREEPVGLADVLPTLLDLAGLPASEGLPDSIGVVGRSLAPQLRARPIDEPPTYAFSELYRSPAKCRKHGGRRCAPASYAVHGRRYKLVAHRPDGPDELFDVDADPAELHDISTDHPEQVERLQNALKGYLTRATPGPAESTPPSELPGERPDEPVGEIPDEVRKQLEALGYVGEDAVHTAP